MNKENWTSCEILNCSISELDLSEHTKLRLMDELFNIQDETFELQDKIDKAIEYIEEMQKSDLIFTSICEKELLNILKGE